MATALGAWPVGVARAKAPPLPSIPLAFSTATTLRAPAAGKPATRVPVVDRDFIDEQLAQANAIFGEFEIRFHEARTLGDAGEKFMRVDSRADRDAITDLNQAGVVNIYFIDALRDVDAPDGFRMGVTWRKLTNLKKKAILVASSARPTTMAHELGHFLGNDHSSVKNNLMSYDRDGGKVTLNVAQATKARRTAAALFATKELENVEG